MHLAAMAGFDKIAKNIGKYLESKLTDGWTVAHIAAQSGDLYNFKCQTQNKIDKNPKAKDGTTPLHLGATYNFIEIVKDTIKDAKDKNPANKNGWTPLHCCADNDERNEMFMIIGEEVKKGLESMLSLSSSNSV